MFIVMLGWHVNRMWVEREAGGEGIPAEPYTSLEHVRRELFHCRQLCRDHRWRSIDVTGKSVEEVSREIIALLPKDEPKGRPLD